MTDMHQLPDDLIAEMTAKARTAARILAQADDATKAAALVAAAAALRRDADTILAANAQDMEAGAKAGLSAAMLDRLKLDQKRISAVADAVDQVAVLEDPVGQLIDSRTQPNGLVMRRVRIPVGVLGIIYESRPNVTADAAALGLRAGNAVLLRGGSEAVHSNRAIHKAMVSGIVTAGLPADAVQLVPTQDRAAVGAMLRAQGAIDMIIPRGGKSLVARVQDEARVPVLAHLDGINHSYVHKDADPAMATDLTMPRSTMLRCSSGSSTGRRASMMSDSMTAMQVAPGGGLGSATPPGWVRLEGAPHHDGPRPDRERPRQQILLRG